MTALTPRQQIALAILPTIYDKAIDHLRLVGYPKDWRHDIALDAYKMADAMMDMQSAQVSEIKTEPSKVAVTADMIDADAIYRLTNKHFNDDDHTEFLSAMVSLLNRNNGADQ